MANPNPSFLNGVPELVILKLLSTQPMYGYQLVKAIQQSSQEQFAFGEGCIYPTLHDLERRRLLTSQRRTIAGRNRHYYRLTVRGEKRLTELSQEWQRVVNGVRLVFGGTYA